MKRKNILLSTVLSILVGIGATAYAATDQSSNSSNSNTSTTEISDGIGLRRITGKRGYDFSTSVIKDRLKVTDEDIAKAREEGKTLSEYAQEKGLSHEDLRAAMVDTKNKAVDEAISKGTISKEDGENYKKLIQENSIQGVPGQGRLNSSKGNSNGSYTRGKGNGRGNGGKGLRNSNNCIISDSQTK